jgi:hypothetical protein
MRKREPEIDILAAPIWEQATRWKTNDFYGTKTRQKNLIVWAYHALPPLVKHRLHDTNWIRKSQSYHEALSQLHEHISLLELTYSSDETSQFSQQCRCALLEIARFEAYLFDLASTEQEENR